VDSTPLLGDPHALRQRLDRDSHLLLRGLLPRGDVLAVRRDLTGTVQRAGWIAEGSDAAGARPGPRACREGGPTFGDMYTAVQAMESFHRFAHHPRLRTLASTLLDAHGDDDLFVYPLKILRAALPQDPGFITPPHQDFPLIQGTVDVLTMWIPLGDVPARMGGLRALRGSHRHGFRRVQGMAGTGGLGVRVRQDDPRWASADFQAGDVLLFHSLTVHGSVPNTSDRLRLSVDFRYQRSDDAICDFALRPHYHPVFVPGFDTLTRGWSTTRWVDPPQPMRVVDRFDVVRERRTPPSRLLSVGGRR
jgi:hypothetical protein